MTELHCIISGRVQGVGYRDFVKNIGTELNLKGFVANLPDGSVEVLLRCAITPELKQWILGFGPDAEVLEPEDLRRDVRDALEQAARRYR